MKEIIRRVSHDGSSVAQIVICRDPGLGDDERRIEDIRERFARQEDDARRLQRRLCLAGCVLLLVVVGLMFAALGYGIATH